ncbi:MAG: LCP family protein [Acidimicrobiales bacterium]|jgi:LCP family protein required for cell wall assembly
MNDGSDNNQSVVASSESRREAESGRCRAWRTRHRAKLARRSRARVWGTRSAIAIVLLIVVIVAATAGYTIYRLGQIRHFNGYGTTLAVKGPTENILLIGSTSRCAASSIGLFKYQCVTQHVNGVNSDVVLIAHLDATNHSVSLLSIPRDSFVPGARSGNSLCGGTWSNTPGLCANKIDAALSEGPDQLAQAIEQDFGIPINHIVDLNFATFEDVVNALGGLWMYFPDKLIDASAGVFINRTGCIHLNGTEALAYVRSRHLFYFTAKQTPNLAAIRAANTPNGPWFTPDSGGNYDGTGDLGRILRVHLFLKALAEQVQARGLGNPVTDNSLISAIAPNLTTDDGLSGLTLVTLAFDYRDAKIGTAPELTLPTINDAAAYYYEGGGYGDVIFPSEPQDQQAIDEFLGTTPSGWKLAPSSISVSVIDGTNSATNTASVAAQLGTLGYRIVATRVSRYVGPVAETTVLYNGRTHLEQAEKVMSSLSGAVVLGQGIPAGGADVSVVTGSILAVDKPTSATAAFRSRPTIANSGVTSPTATASSSTAPPPTSNPNIGVPTSANPTIPPWDARSCPKVPG